MINHKLIPACSGIYKFTNKINNKVYIGQTKNLRKRIKNHINFNMDSKIKSYFYNSIRFHGIENFELEILFQGDFTKDELDQMEITLIRLFKSNNPLFGYNITAGGGGRSGLPISEEHKQKLSKIHKGKIVSEQTRQKLKINSTGVIKSESTRKKLSARIISELTREKLSKSHKGKNLGKPCLEKTKEKLRAFNLGKKQSEKTINKRIETRKNNKLKKQLIELFYIEFMKI